VNLLDWRGEPVMPADWLDGYRRVYPIQAAPPLREGDLCRCGHARVYHEKQRAADPDGRCLHPGQDGLGGPCPCPQFARAT
jgi:hypothetical protein